MKTIAITIISVRVNNNNLMLKNKSLYKNNNSKGNNKRRLMKMKLNTKNMQMKNFIWKVRILNNCNLINNFYLK